MSPRAAPQCCLTTTRRRSDSVHKLRRSKLWWQRRARPACCDSVAWQARTPHYHNSWLVFLAGRCQLGGRGNSIDVGGVGSEQPRGPSSSLVQNASRYDAIDLDEDPLKVHNATLARAASRLDGDTTDLMLMTRAAAGPGARGGDGRGGGARGAGAKAQQHLVAVNASRASRASRAWRSRKQFCTSAEDATCPTRVDGLTT